jgi:hypothetical protein
MERRYSEHVMVAVHHLSWSDLRFRESLELAGTPWVVATNSEVIVRTLHRWKAPRQTNRRFALRVLVDDRLHRSDEAPVYRGMNHVAFATFGSDFFGFDLLRKQITAVVCPETACDETFWNRVLWPIAIGVMGCFIGVVPLHSACLEWNGSGVLVAGVSGAGKSTLAAAMAHSGFSFLSDDWTYIARRNGNLVACGLDVPIKLLPDTARFFDGLANHRVARSLNGELAYEIEAAHFSSHTIRECVPHHLFMLERRTSGPSEFRKLPPEPARDFFEQSSEPFPEVLSHGREFRSIILNQVASLQCWCFTYSGSPHDAAASIRRFIEQ